MTRESNMASLPSMIRHGTLPSGLDVEMVLSGAQTSSITNWYSSRFSASTTRTLRT